VNNRIDKSNKIPILPKVRLRNEEKVGTTLPFFLTFILNSAILWGNERIKKSSHHPNVIAPGAVFQRASKTTGTRRVGERGCFRVSLAILRAEHELIFVFFMEKTDSIFHLSRCRLPHRREEKNLT